LDGWLASFVRFQMQGQNKILKEKEKERLVTLEGYSDNSSN